MEFSLEDVKQIEQIIQLADTLRPLMGLIVELIRKYCGELQPLAEGFDTWMVKETHREIMMYKTLGYTKEEAILLVLDKKAAFSSARENFRFNNK